jgi:DNA invertase Pin-like site-specific DNA recombinase
MLIGYARVSTDDQNLDLTTGLNISVLTRCWISAGAQRAS